ncbi:MAG: redoxin domain-containing protein [Nitriliruptorales bacterium]|nr:redoxin domain-containing protein [Nitriliruptorales bacterium]
MPARDRLPDCTATLDDGRTVRLSELLESGPAVFFFYPKAFTTGCTAEACHFRDLAAEFAAAGAQRFGVSRDSVETQSEFREKYNLDFPLIADPDGRVAAVFGAKRLGPLPRKRQTFVVDTDHRILKVISSELNMDVHADEALAALAARGRVITLPEEQPAAPE